MSQSEITLARWTTIVNRRRRYWMRLIRCNMSMKAASEWKSSKAVWRSTWMSWPDNVPASWPTHQSLPTHSGKEKSSSPVCGTQESDWSASLAPAEIEVREGAVLLGSGCAEHQATGAVPQPTDKPCCIRYCLAQARKEICDGDARRQKYFIVDALFQHSRPLHSEPGCAIAMQLGFFQQLVWF